MQLPIHKIEEIKYQIEDYLLFCLNNEESLHFLKSQEPALFDAVEMFVMRKAKRIRPILFLLAFQGYAQQEDKTVMHAAVGVELMHTFALIHDDIIDQSSMRDKNPSLYHAIDLVSRKPDFSGERMAMLIGDLIYNIALKEFQKVKLKYAEKVSGMELLLDTALRTGHGQLMEMVQATRNLAGVTPRQILKIYDLKTAYYTFCLPFELGAMIAGQKKKELKKLKEVGLHLGRAYQIIDDLNDFSSDELVSGNFLSALLWKQAEPEEKKQLRKMFSVRKNKALDTEWLEDLYMKHNIIRLATTEVYKLIEAAKADISGLGLHGDMKEEVVDYINSIMKIKK